MAAIALITGAGGLLGQHLLRHWRADDPELVLVDRRVDDLLVHGVPTDLIERIRPDVVVHLAWTASGTPGYRTSSDNDGWVDASLELARACLITGARLCATGTALDTGPPTDPYSEAKTRLRRELDPEITAGAIAWLRPFYVVSPEQRRPALVAQAMAATASGQPLELQTPDSAHDFIHACDAGSAIMLTVRHALTGEVAIGSGTSRRVRDLVEALGVTWRPAELHTTPPPHHHAAADTDRLRTLGWHPTKTEELFHRD